MRKASKMRTHAVSCQAVGKFFQPLVIETFGAWDLELEAIKFLKKISARAALRKGIVY